MMEKKKLSEETPGVRNPRCSKSQVCVPQMQSPTFLVVLVIAWRLSLTGPNLSHACAHPSDQSHGCRDMLLWWSSLSHFPTPERKVATKRHHAILTTRVSTMGPRRQEEQTDSLKIGVAPRDRGYLCLLYHG